jgi:hypothetical protein
MYVVPVTSVSDPDPDWILIQIGPADPDLGRLNLYSKMKKKRKNFMPEEPEHSL